jgi:adenylate kinase family enzyme
LGKDVRRHSGGLRRVAVITSASGNGGTTFAREASARLGLPFHELDALFWKPNWTEPSAEEFRRLVEPIAASDEWVVDGSYYSKIGDVVLRRAELVVWLDLPVWVWLPRLVHRTVARVVRGHSLWGTNRESLRTALFARDSLLWWTLGNYRGRRLRLPVRLAPFDYIRLRSTREVERFLRAL